MKFLFITIFSFILIHPAFSKLEANSTTPKYIGLDVRTGFETRINPANGSLNIPIGDLEKKVISMIPDKSQEIIVFCESGGRSDRAKKILNSMGYKNIKDIKTWRVWNKKYNSNQ
ncbi:MAG: rhodanese-like domain-containing protein [Bdellovibrionales bacterium]|nr:rhodanese-like domain-containing protein [Bdellovibrionales bacterium]